MNSESAVEFATAFLQLEAAKVARRQAEDQYKAALAAFQQAIMELRANEPATK